MRRASLALAIAAVAALGGCSTATDILEGRRVDYKSAGALPPLEIPPDLTTPTRDNRYIVPETGKGAATLSGFQAERAQQAKLGGSTTVLPPVDRMRVERSGSQRWLVVKGEADAVWNVVKEFWQETGFIVNVENPDAGVMETDWAENRAKIPQGGIRGLLGKVVDNLYSTAERDKFRTRLERSTEPGMTEVYISHRGMEEVYVTADRDETKWQPRPPDPDLEAEMLRRLMSRFGVQQARAKSEVAAAQAPLRATLFKGRDGGTLSVNDQFDRAWRRVGLALDRVGFTVEDRDRSKGLYFVRYVDSDADNRTAQPKGFFAKLNPFRSTPKPSGERFSIRVRDADSVSQVSVLDKDGKQEKSETANRILSLLYDQLK